MEEPSSSRQRKPRTTVIVQEMNPASGFVAWLRQNAVVGLAIGFVVGTQVQVVVKQLISSFIDPLFTLFFGQELSNKAFYVTLNGTTAKISWGLFLNVLINFLFTLLAIYIIIKILKLDKLDQPKDKDKK